MFKYAAYFSAGMQVQQTGITEQQILPFTVLSEHPCNNGFALMQLWQADGFPTAL